MSAVSRRRFLRQSAAAAGTLVVGFDLSTRAWAIAGERAGRLAPGFPAFDGTLWTDDAALRPAADDFGHLVHRRPLAVLEPGSVEDLVRLIRFARRLGIGVAARGQGHSAHGQPQVDAGVVIDMSALAGVHDVGREMADVGGGATWRALLDRTLARGLTPPTLTDYQDLSVGGTLSVGGIGGAGFRYGAQVDNVIELEVVTGAGRRMRCSRTRAPRLFDAALLSGLDLRDQVAITDMTFVAFATRLDPIVEQQRQAGVWQLPHPWFDVWLPDGQAEAFAGRVLSELTLEDTGGGPILLYPTRSAPFTRPLLRVPAGELIWQFDILRTALPTAAPAEKMVRDNHAGILAPGQGIAAGSSRAGRRGRRRERDDRSDGRL